MSALQLMCLKFFGYIVEDQYFGLSFVTIQMPKIQQTLEVFIEICFYNENNKTHKQSVFHFFFVLYLSLFISPIASILQIFLSSCC